MAMTPNPELGVLFHAIGGLAAGSFYLPLKGVRRWSWETFWLVNGVASWIIAPTVGALLTCPHPFQALAQAPSSSLLWAFIFGALWGIGGLTFGLSMRYLGMSLGYALALGSCAVFGTLIPPLFRGKLLEQFQSHSGLVVMAGLLVCIGGIAVCGWAGMRKEAEQSDADKRATISEFSFKKGVLVALFAGIMSACMAFAIDASKPIAAAAVALGANETFSYNPAYIVIMLGGFATNLVWCLYLQWRNKTAREYLSPTAPILLNLLLCAAAGITWYLQFFFYGMGSINLGKRYDFSSWTLHMAFIIIFSNVWALLLREWKGSARATRWLIGAGIGILIFSTIVIGYGTKIGKDETPAPAATSASKES